MLGHKPRNRKLLPQRAREIPTTILDVVRGTHQASGVTARLHDDAHVKLGVAAQTAGFIVEAHAANVLTWSVAS